ncbi:MAG: TatD family hydrolase [Propionibacteriaceae bacterium]|nr:TatD family hydrolase [Propionibacteriaceae bacterium]
MSKHDDQPAPAPEPLPRPTIDAHTHLASTVRRAGWTVDEILAMARRGGVDKVVDVGWDVPSSRQALAEAEAHREVVACVAIHPSDAAELGQGLDAELARLEALVGSSPLVRGVGETGLDYYWVKDEAGRARQRRAFAAHIAWAKQRRLPLVIHDRDAHADVLDVLDGEGWPDQVMMHCFSGDADFARQCLDRGACLSFPGTVTFKPNEALREALDVTPADRMLVETDAPYLTPMPYRGRPNAPYLVPLTVRFMAERLGRDLAELCDTLRGNAERLFGSWG